MRKKQTLLALALLACATWIFAQGCAVDTPNAPFVRMNQTAFRVGALGNSLTAGYLNSGLVQGGQLASFANLVAMQAGVESFAMPLIDEPGIGPANDVGIPQSPLYVDATGAIVTDNVLNPMALLLNSLHPVPYHNLGVPGGTTNDMTTTTNSTNSDAPDNLFFDMILRNFNVADSTGLPPGNLTQMDMMTAVDPQILLLWTGNNEILLGATDGNPIVGVPPAGNVLPAAAWEVTFDTVLDGIDAMDPPFAAVVNIPGIPSIPYFTTVPVGTLIDGVGFVRWMMAEDLDADADSVVYVILPSPVADPTQAPAYLPAAFGGTDTLASNFTLTAAEIAAVDAVVDGYNAIIAAAAADRGWALVDAHAMLDGLPKDPTNPTNFLELNAIYGWLQGQQNTMSAISLDGIHPSERGHARLANECIEALNGEYDLGIPAVTEGAVKNLLGFEQAPTALP